jgi:hypothetical protein
MWLAIHRHRSDWAVSCFWDRLYLAAQKAIQDAKDAIKQIEDAIKGIGI